MQQRHPWGVIMDVMADVHPRVKLHALVDAMVDVATVANHLAHIIAQGKAVLVQDVMIAQAIAARPALEAVIKVVKPAVNILRIKGNNSICMNKIISIIFSLFIAFTVNAQDKIYEYAQMYGTINGEYKIVPEEKRSVNLSIWMNGGTAYMISGGEKTTESPFRQVKENDTKYYKYNPLTGEYWTGRSYVDPNQWIVSYLQFSEDMKFVTYVNLWRINGQIMQDWMFVFELKEVK